MSATYSYKVVEASLASTFSVEQARLGSFRGRIGHLQRIGIVPSSPGRGRRIQYSFEDVAKWAFTLEVEEFGMDPTVCVTIVDGLWSMVKPASLKSPRGLLIMAPAMISDPKGWTATATVTDRTGLLTIAQTWPRRLMVIDLEHLYTRLADALRDLTEMAACA